MLYLQIMVASTLGSILALGGGLLLLWKEDIAKKFSLMLVSFAAGSLIGVAFLDLIPEAMETAPYNSVALLVIVGILFIFLIEKILRWYHCHDKAVCDIHTTSSMVILGDSMHNFIDGIIIAASFSINPYVGLTTTLAVFMHEVPQEIGDFGILIHSGYSKFDTILYNVLSSLATLVGATLGYFLLPVIAPYIGILLALAAGIFIYIAVSDLLPEIRHVSTHLDVPHIAMVVIGVWAIWFIGMVFPEAG